MSKVKQVFGYLFPLAFRFRPFYFTLVFLDFLLAIILPVIDVICPKFIVDELITAQNIKKLIGFVVITAAGNIGISFLRRVISENVEKYDDLFSNYFVSILSQKVMEMEFEKTENAKTLNEMMGAINGMSWYSGGFVGLVDNMKGIFISIIVTIEVVVIIALNAPWLFIMVAIFVVIENVFNAKENSIEMKYYSQLSTINRKLDYVYQELSNVKYGKDIRLFNAKQLMIDKSESYSREVIDTFNFEANETYKIRFIKNIFQNLSSGVSYGYLGALTMLGKISIGDFTMLLSAALSMISNVKAVVGGCQELYKKSCYASNYVEFIDKHNRIQEMNTCSLLKKKFHCIEFKNVSFKYPNSEKYIFKNLNLKLNIGEKLSIVGKNGAGKTTFIKILTRLYTIDDGEILIDGKNIYEIDYEEYIRLFAVIFQDYKLLSLSLIDNITIGKEIEENQKHKIEDLLCEMNLFTKIKELKNGIESNLYKDFDENGFVPSGGEEQKIALLRALYKDSPFIILDEPTASLDPRTEYEINKQFDKMIHHDLAIYISHRLSSCRLCDKIVVFDEGKVVEYGSHEELMRNKNGLYYKLFSIQAENYS